MTQSNTAERRAAFLEALAAAAIFLVTAVVLYFVFGYRPS